MPGERTTTSQRRSAAGSATTSSPSGGGPSSTSTSGVPGRRSATARAMARPSRPSPQIPTRRPSSSEKRTDDPIVPLRHGVLARAGQPGPDRPGIGSPDAGGERRDDRVPGPPGRRRGRAQGGARLVGLPHALERLLGVDAEDGAEARLLGGVVEEVRAEDGDEGVPLEEGGEGEE